jgi:hypothetical protein
MNIVVGTKIDGYQVQALNVILKLTNMFKIQLGPYEDRMDFL